MDISRRRMVTGLAGVAAATMSGCAGPRGPLPAPLPPPRAAAAPWPVEDPATVGLNAVIDISHSTTVIDFARARNDSGILGVIHKASEGWDWVDPAYAQRRAQAEAAGMLWGAYHFGTVERPGADQAANFLAIAQPRPDTLIALDLELNDRLPGNSMTLGRAEEFVQAVYATTNRLPMLYVHPAWADGFAVGKSRRTLGGAIQPGTILAACDLWLADYRVQPELPKAWEKRGWRLWQYAGDGNSGAFSEYAGQVAGVGRCDRSVFASDSAGLARYWQSEAGRTLT